VVAAENAGTAKAWIALLAHTILLHCGSDHHWIDENLKLTTPE
jgi:hypothetical protein